MFVRVVPWSSLVWELDEMKAFMIKHGYRADKPLPRPEDNKDWYTGQGLEAQKIYDAAVADHSPAALGIQTKRIGFDFALG